METELKLCNLNEYQLSKVKEYIKKIKASCKNRIENTKLLSVRTLEEWLLVYSNQIAQLLGNEMKKIIMWHFESVQREKYKIDRCNSIEDNLVAQELLIAKLAHNDDGAEEKDL